ncbi:MAG: hypothetical protein ABJG78_19815 [Cyclobacteriaceae bacterium]
MKKINLVIYLVVCSLSASAQWSGPTPGNIYYSQGNVGIGTASPEALLDQVSTNSTVHQRMFWNANNTDAAEVDRARISFGTKNFAGSTRTWGIYAYSQGLHQSFGGGLRFTGLVGAVETEVMRIHNGKIGIGTTAPEALLDQVSTNSTVHQRMFWNANNTDAAEVDRARISFGTKNFAGSTRTWGIYAYSQGLHQGFGEGLRFTGLVGAVETEVMRIYNGNVGIGTPDPLSKLSVNGHTRATEVKVLADITVPNYVFESNYDLRTLEETKAYIAENKHLPEIPSAAEIEENGIDLGI